MKEAGAAELTPGKKRLVQARLPFKLLGAAAAPAPAPAPAPALRKRKLSARPDEPRPAKLCKENEEALAEPVLISDDSQDAAPARPDNPYLRIVDTAIKKKLDKKTPKKKKSKNKLDGEKRKKNKEPENPPDVNEITIDVDPEIILENDTNQNFKIIPEKSAVELEDDDLVLVEDPTPVDTLQEDVDMGEPSTLKETDTKKDGKTDKASLKSPSKDYPLKESSPKSSAKAKTTNSQRLSSPVKVSLESSTNDQNSLEQPSFESPSKEQNTHNLSEASPNEDHAEQLNTTDLTDENEPKTDVCTNNDVQGIDIDIEIRDLNFYKSPPSSPNRKTESPSTPDSKHTTKNTIDNRDSSSPKEIESSCTIDKAGLESKNVTPKRRSIRTKNSDKITNDEQISPTESTNNEMSMPVDTTPKQIKKKSMGASTESNEGTSPANKSLTPKQVQRKLESAKKREEKEKERQDREQKRLQEKEERNKVRLEKEEQKRKEKEEREEQRKKEREEREEQKKKEKEEKERQKELEKKEKEEKEEQKRKEREEKEEQRRKEKEARDEERRKKQEALDEEKRHKELEKQEQEIKKKKAAAAFVNFFVPKQRTEQTESSTQSKNSMLSCFMVKSDMRLAPTVRNYLESDQKQSLDVKLKSQEVSKKRLYLQSLRDKTVKPGRCNKTWPLEEKEDDCVIVESEDELPPAVDGSGEFIMNNSMNRERLRPKLLSFHDNRRPPYWGTWRKKSSNIRPRNPFGTDQKHLDYEVDSDEEWEDEGEGESIAGSVAGSTEENNEIDEYEVDNEFFVPHGYLSDEEATVDDDDVMSLSPETQKAKLKHLEDEFESEMKKPTEKLKPRLYGMLWENSDGGQPSNCVDSLWKYFSKMAMILNDPTALLVPAPEPEESDKKKAKKKKSLIVSTGVEGSPKTAEKKRKSKPVKREIAEVKKSTTETMKNQPGINTFLTKIKS